VAKDKIEELIEHGDVSLIAMWAEILAMPRRLYRNGPIVYAHPNDIAKSAALKARLP
jgi:hypothetical protein